MAARLGSARPSGWCDGKITILKSRRAELVYALSLEYAESVQSRRIFWCWGRCVRAFVPLPAFGKDKRARFDSLYAVLDALRSGIAKVETQLALLDSDRRAADQKAWKSALLLLGGLALIGGGDRRWAALLPALALNRIGWQSLGCAHGTRPLADMERAFICSIAAPRFNGVQVVTLRGRSTSRCCGRRYLRLRARHPLLRVRLRGDDKSCFWTDEDHGPLPLTGADKAQRQTGSRSPKTELNRPFDREGDP